MPAEPTTRNRLRFKLPDIGTICFRTDRKTGGAEARLKAPSGMQESYQMKLPAALPSATRPLSVGLDGQVGHGIGRLIETATWNPGSLNNGDKDSTTVTVTGASIGDPVLVGFSQAVPSGMILRGDVTSAGTVTVTLFNVSAGAAQDLSSGTLTVVVKKV